MPRKTARLHHRRDRGRAASMRPRPDAAENCLLSLLSRPARPASMRPRPDAAENGARSPAPRPTSRGFNEAAARCRGKQRDPEPPAEAGVRASMRPRPDAAENDRGEGGLGVTALASMRPRPDAAENITHPRGIDPGWDQLQ